MDLIHPISYTILTTLRSALPQIMIKSLVLCYFHHEIPAICILDDAVSLFGYGLYLWQHSLWYTLDPMVEQGRSTYSGIWKYWHHQCIPFGWHQSFRPCVLFRFLKKCSSFIFCTRRVQITHGGCLYFWPYFSHFSEL